MTFEPLQILLVDDNEDDVVLIQEAFAEARLANIIDVVGDGEQAMRYLRRQGDFGQAPRPGLVLLDINMPKKNGFEVLSDMKADPRLREIPVVILTTSSQEEDVANSYRNGACSYVTKPVRFEEMIRVAKDFSIYWVMVARVPQWKDP